MRHKGNYTKWSFHRIVVNALLFSAIALALFSRGCAQTPPPAFAFRTAEEPIPFVKVGGLDQKYAAFNAAWFNDDLPKDISIRYVFIDSKTIGLTVKNPNDGHFTIFISPYFNRGQQQADLTLFHEMCHVATWTTDFQHGEAFQSCMIERAKRGAFADLW